MARKLRYRKELQKRDGQRFRCRAMVERFGSKPSFRGPPKRTILLCNVVDAETATLLTDHLWFTSGVWSLNLCIGDVFEFEARVADYEKGYRGRRDDVYAPVGRDWHLQRPTKVTIVARNQAHLQPIKSMTSMTSTAS